MRALLPIVFCATGCIDLDAFSRDYDAGAATDGLSVGDGLLVDGLPASDLSGDMANGCVVSLPTSVPLLSGGNKDVTASIASLADPSSPDSQFLVGAVRTDGNIGLVRFSVGGTLITQVPLACVNAPCAGVRVAKALRSADSTPVIGVDGTTTRGALYLLATDQVTLVNDRPCATTSRLGDAIGDAGAAVFAPLCKTGMVTLYDQNSAGASLNISPNELRMTVVPGTNTGFLAFQDAPMAPLSLYHVTLSTLATSPIETGAVNGFAALALDAVDLNHVVVAGATAGGALRLRAYDRTGGGTATSIPSSVQFSAASTSASNPLGIAVGKGRFMVVYEEPIMGAAVAIFDAATLSSIGVIEVSATARRPQIAVEPKADALDSHGVFVVTYYEPSGDLRYVRVSCP